MSSSRILLVSHRFVPHYTAGTELYTAALAQGWLERGHSVTIFTGDPHATAPRREVWGGVQIHVQPWGLLGSGSAVDTFLAGFFNPRVEQAFEALCAEFKPDVIHVLQLLGLSPRLLHLGKRSGAKIILTLMDFWFVCSNTWLFRWNQQVCSGPEWGYHCAGCALQRLGVKPQPLLMAMAAPLFWLRTQWLKRVLQEPHQIVAPSRLCQTLIKQLSQTLQTIILLPLALSAPALQPSTSPSGNSSVRFVYLGSLIPPKGVHVVIEAFNRLGPTTAQLHIYGDSRANPTYFEQLRRIAHHPQIEFHDVLPHAEVGQVLAAADLLLMPSLWYETYALVVDDAWRAGVPVLVSNHTAVAERVEVGKNGWLAPPGDVEAWAQRMRELVASLPSRSRRQTPYLSPTVFSDHLNSLAKIYFSPNPSSKVLME